MFNPVSTYRIQFHKEFTFTHLENIIPYLSDLGICTLYASPIFKAVPGSNHGYDVTDPLQINPEIGTLEQLKNISKKLKDAGISWLQDIVPNHMAFHPDNAWLMDLLKNGANSAYKNYFDQVLADGSLFKGKIMVPFLGDDLDTVITNGELRIIEKGGEYFFNYSGQHWPVNLTDTESEDISQCNLAEVAERQHYRLCSWRETSERINYRRFFTVNGLICLNIHHEEVFDHYHQLIAQLLEEGIFQGLRVDHIDGLYDPEAYLQRLRDLAGEDTYIVVEKILEDKEQLPQWPIQGTTGYDFLAQVNNLFTNSTSKDEFTRYYEKLNGNQKGIDEQIADKKTLILTTGMQGELENLTEFFIGLGLGDEASRQNIKEGIAQLLVNFPVYRFYGNKWPLNESENNQLKAILEHNPSEDVKKLPDSTSQQALAFYRRCMQFSGPLMAKGVEDTLMYTYNRFIDHNEVGDSPAAFGLSVGKFHGLMQKRQQHWPLALNATATHDTKRGEGVRARLNVLTYMQTEWLALVDNWRQINKSFKTNNAPDNNDEYFIYQTLIGACPVDENDLQEFTDRLKAYLEKMLREAKSHSNWDSPNEAYEQGVMNFAEALLNTSGPFWSSFKPFLQQVSIAGEFISQNQAALKLLCPGVPDIYQGCELNDFSFVDPDNRRPVDYTHRKALLKSGEGRIALINRLLILRASSPNLFLEGDYLPIEVKGTHAEKIIAFARVLKDLWIVAVIPLAPVSDWEDTTICLPPEAPLSAESVLTGEGRFIIKSTTEVNQLLGTNGIAVLKLQQSNNPRSAGILLHITSLPSDCGCGDMGAEAYKFADILKKSGQRVWQVLPLNAVHQQESFSPYSPVSSQAGNIMLINPDLLAKDGLIERTDIKLVTNSTFAATLELRKQITELAWHNYKQQVNPAAKPDFEAFCTQESSWLKDFGLYTLLKQQFNEKPWYKWPDDYKFRRAVALQTFASEHTDKLEIVYFQQYLFNKQWTNLKAYCNRSGIKIFGDLPFYISYDSVDVWSSPQLFHLDEHLNPVTVSGVPPDYFNADGQRWGTPTYNWEVLAADNYNWWVQRIAKNLQWFDLLRLDHFRAFSAYWEVPAKEETAKNGRWVKGPGAPFFDILAKEFNPLPLVAEDLGDIDDDVYTLKNKFNLPGMKVLQFAFGKDIAVSPYVPFNHEPADFIYTGTHDNNTTKGWYNTDTDEHTRKNLDTYTGHIITAENAADRMIFEAMKSVGQTVIIPLQDWLNLDENSRMNTPAGTGNNWTWQLKKEQLAAFPEEKIKRWTTIFGRA